MDISNLTQASSATSAVSKVAEAIGISKPSPQGNSLPVQKATRDPSGNSPSETAAQPSPEELRNLIDQANSVLSRNSSNLKFTVADGTNINVIRIEDSETGELIRQVPSETMLAIARAFDEIKQGVMVEEKV